MITSSLDWKWLQRRFIERDELGYPVPEERISLSPTVPVTSAIDANQAIETLTHDEMIALAKLYERWALTEARITPEQRTALIVWSSDYEIIAEFVGQEWRPQHDAGISLMPFVAKLELASS